MRRESCAGCADPLQDRAPLGNESEAMLWPHVDVGAQFLVQLRLVKHDAFAAHIDQRIRRAEIDGDVVRT